MERKHVWTIIVFLLLSTTAIAQDRTRVVSASLAVDDDLAAKVIGPTYIPKGSKVYVASIDGLPHFENNLVAAFQKKRVDLVIVTDRANADFEINGFANSESPPGWTKIIFGGVRPESEASIQMVNVKTGVVAYAVASYKVNSHNGNKSTAEHMAKNLRKKMERDEKRLRK